MRAGEFVAVSGQDGKYALYLPQFLLEQVVATHRRFPFQTVRSGFANAGVNLNYTMGRGVTAYGKLRNALNRQYEEVFGFPSPKLNFVAGLKWTIGRVQ